MNRRIAAIALLVLTAAICPASQDESRAGEAASDAASGLSEPVPRVPNETAALEAAWSALESKKSPEPGKTIRRRGVSAKSEVSPTSRSPAATSSSWLRSIGSLVAVVAVILFLAWGAKSLTRGGPLAGRAKRSGVIEIISRTALSPRQSLCLVRVGQRMVLVGVTPESLRTLDVIPDADAVAALAGEAAADGSADAKRAFRANLERETLSYEAQTSDQAAAPTRSGMNDVRQRLSAALARVRGAARPDPR